MPIYGFDERPKTYITGNPADIFEQIEHKGFVCLIGSNSSGKSYVLQTLTQRLEGRGVYLGPSRYNNFNTLAPYTPKRRRRRRKRFQEFSEQFTNTPHNIDKSPFNIQQAIAALNDSDRSE